MDEKIVRFSWPHENDLVFRQDAIEAIIRETNQDGAYGYGDTKSLVNVLDALPSAQPYPVVDADKLKRCRFEYINACKIVAHPTPDTSKNDIYDANAVIKALHPIFGDAEF